MSCLRGSDRSEVQLLPACLDDYVAPNAPDRFLDAYVEKLDFKALGFVRAQPADTGRPDLQEKIALLQERQGRYDELPGEMKASGQTIFPREKFACDPAADTDQCPGGQTLARAGKNQKHGADCALYYNRAACAACPRRSQCTTREHRVIARRSNQAVVDRAAARRAAHPEKMAARMEIVEQVFGTLRLWHHDRFLMRGLDQVRAEFSLSAAVYNLRRVLNVVRMTDLLQVAAVAR